METKAEFLRYASPNEMRTIAREDVGYYHAVVIGAVYSFPEGVDVKSPATYFHALRRCVEEHPFFCVIVGDRHTDKAYYERMSSINVEEHISIVEDSSVQAGSLEAIGRSMESELDRPFVAGIPPWRIVVLPLSSSQCHIAFSYSHSIGDGIAGVAFHKTFLSGLNELLATVPSSTISPPAKPFPEVFDTDKRLPISWSFLLAPFLAAYMPYFLVKMLGLRVSASYVNEGTWTATPIFFDPETHRNKLKIRHIGASQVNKAVQLARTHDARLTGVMHQIIVRALSKAVADNNVTNFVPQTAVNMRRSIGMSNDVAHDVVSGCYTVHPRSAATGPLTEEEWASASEATKHFAMTSTKLEDCAIGLLRYIPSMRKWTLGKIGKKRDTSYEFSNVGVFDAGLKAPDAPAKEQVEVTKLTFAQPSHVGGCPICFNVASVKGGDLVYTVTWQPGALGLGDEAEEERIVEEICDNVQQGFEDMA